MTDLSFLWHCPLLGLHGVFCSQLCCENMVDHAGHLPTVEADHVTPYVFQGKAEKVLFLGAVVWE